MALADGKRNLWKGMSTERPVRQRAWFAWAYDGVTAVKKRIAIFKISRIVRILSVVVVGAHNGVNNPHNHDPMLEGSM